jgi:uncharacterized coiled-coil DUF342 family protein
MAEQELEDYVEQAAERVKELRSKLDDVAQQADEEADQLDLQARERLEEAEQVWRRAEMRLQELREAASDLWTEEKDHFDKARDELRQAVERASESLGD